ncbi:hypothetical protein Tco_1540191 [Tanacetum coccineum]
MKPTIRFLQLVSEQVALDIQGYTWFWFDEKKVFVLVEVLLIFDAQANSVKLGFLNPNSKLVMIYGRQKESRCKGAADVTYGFDSDVVAWKSMYNIIIEAGLI